MVARERFIQLWGGLGSEWGINRTMAQIHALLLTSPAPLSAEEVMEALHVSRGSANMNLRELIGWGLISRHVKHGERKEFFVAEKEIWEVARRIAIERRKRELDPMMRCIDELLAMVERDKSDEAKGFKKLLTDIRTLGKRSSAMLDLVLKVDQSSFFKPLLKMFR